MTSHRHPELGEKLFTFAIIADSHLNPEEDVSSSPFETNRVANARSRTVIRQLNRASPAFVLHLGDIVHPVPKLASYSEAAARFRELFAELEAPLKLIPGNHDVGDKPVAWAPAGTVCEPWIALYREHFGPDYQSFDHGGLHFVMIDAQVINSGLPTEAAQRAWLEADLSANDGKRIIVGTHYPPYVESRHEPSTYDNIDEPGRSWLLGLCERHRVEAVYSGHVHNFFWDVHRGTELSILPSIALVRMDFSELFRVAPAPDAEQGRNDHGKLGYYLVDVHERGRVDRVIRTQGATTSATVVEVARPRLEPLFGREVSRPLLGLDLRHPWAELVDVPPSGALEEFARKKARNDYPLLAIWELGARRLRVPVQDLLDPRVRDRMRLLVARGHAFTAVTYGVPDAALSDALAEHHDALRALEVVLPPGSPADGLAAFRRRVPLRVDVAEIRGRGGDRDAQGRFHHRVDYGLRHEEPAHAEEIAARHAGGAGALGLVFRVPRDTSPWDGVRGAAALAARFGLAANVQVRFGANNIAEVEADDDANALRALEALAAAATTSADVFLDAFVDHDRSYYARNGFYDRRYNPRVGAHALRHLVRVLSELGDGIAEGQLTVEGGARIAVLTTAAATAVVFLSTAPSMVTSLPCAPSADRARAVDLATGALEVVEARAVGGRTAFARPVALAGPAAFLFGT